MKLLFLIIAYSLSLTNVSEQEVSRRNFSTSISSVTPVEKTNQKKNPSKQLKKKRQKKASFKKNIKKQQKESDKISAKTLGYLIGAGIVFLAGAAGFIYLLTIGAATGNFIICGVFMLGGLILFLIVLLIWMKKNGALGGGNFERRKPTPLRELEER